jgi:hypothetical protein
MNACRAPLCQAEVPAGKPFCPSHWRLVPNRMQSRFYHARTSEDRESAITAASLAADEAEHGGRLL